MASYVEGPVRAFVAGGAVGQYLRVVLTTGKVAVAAITDGPSTEIGVAEQPAFADLDVIPIRVRNAQGTQKMVAAEALAVGAAVYTAASGMVADTAAATSYLRGIALTAAGASGDIIEVMPVWPMAQESG